jgi:aryl-alcohol dehydrogenase-like predicted oxidoreductase
LTERLIISTMAYFHREGKIKHIGLCGLRSSTLRRAYKIAPVAAVEIEYSVFVTDIERDNGTNLLQTCRELGVAVVCFGPIGRGFLRARSRALNRLLDLVTSDLRGLLASSKGTWRRTTWSSTISGLLQKKGMHFCAAGHCLGTQTGR